MNSEQLPIEEALAGAAACYYLWQLWDSGSYATLAVTAQQFIQAGRFQEASDFLCALRDAARCSVGDDEEDLLVWIRMLTLLGQVQRMLGENGPAREALIAAKGYYEKLLLERVWWLKAWLASDSERLLNARAFCQDEASDDETVVGRYVSNYYVFNYIACMALLCEASSLTGHNIVAVNAAKAAMKMSEQFAVESDHLSGAIATASTSLMQQIEGTTCDLAETEAALLLFARWFDKNPLKQSTRDHQRVQSLLSVFYGTCGENAKACRHAHMTVRIAKAVGPISLTLANSLQNLSQLMFGSHDAGMRAMAVDEDLPQEPVAMMEEALRIIQSHYPPPHPEVAAALSKLGAMHGDQGNSSKALETGQEALNMFRSLDEATSPQYLVAAHQVAVEMHRARDYQGAQQLFKECLALFPADQSQTTVLDKGSYTEQDFSVHASAVMGNDEYVRTCFNIAASLAMLHQHEECQLWLFRGFQHLLAVFSSHVSLGSETDRGRFISKLQLDLAFLVRCTTMFQATADWRQIFDIACKVKGCMYHMQALQRSHIDDVSTEHRELLSSLQEVRRHLSQAVLTGRPCLTLALARENLEAHLLHLLQQKAGLFPLSNLCCEDVGRKLNANELLVEYLHLRPVDLCSLKTESYSHDAGDYVAFVVTSHACSLPDVQFLTLGPAGRINRLVADFRDVITTPARFQRKERLKDERLRKFLEVGTALKEMLVDPVMQAVQMHHIDVWHMATDAELSRLPFAALPVAGDVGDIQYLIDKDIALCFVGNSGDFACTRDACSPACIQDGTSVFLGDANYSLVCASEPDDSFQEPVHEGVLCDGCYSLGIRKDLRGIRFNCEACADFDLCQNCYQSRADTHDRHVPGGAEHTFSSIAFPGALHAASQSTGNPLQDSELRRNPLRGLKFGPLPCTRHEVQTVARLFEEHSCDADILLADEARASTVLKVQRPPVLHLATHGFFLVIEDDTAWLPVPSKADESRPWRKVQSQPSKESASQVECCIRAAAVKDPLTRTGLAFAGAQTLLDGKAPGTDVSLITALDVRDMDLKTTQLVTLSACETGLGHTYPGEGLWGLVRGFLLAGARSVVATIWEVADEEHAQLMAEFYRRLLNGDSKVLALRGAQRAMKERFPLVPWLWASVVLHGSADGLRIRQT